jgi:hypothetical protein
MDYALCRCSEGILCWDGRNGPCGGRPISKKRLAEIEKKWAEWHKSPAAAAAQATYEARRTAEINAWVRQEAARKRVDELFKKYGCFAFLFL